jgi:hypothetical protein
MLTQNLFCKSWRVVEGLIGRSKENPELQRVHPLEREVSVFPAQLESYWEVNLEFEFEHKLEDMKWPGSHSRQVSLIPSDELQFESN